MTNPTFFNFINNQDYETLKPLWNEYVVETGNGDQIFDHIEDLVEIFEFEPLQLAKMVFFGKLTNWSDNVYLNGYGNIESSWSKNNSPIVVRELADWLEESNHEFYQEWASEREE